MTRTIMGCFFYLLLCEAVSSRLLSSSSSGSSGGSSSSSSSNAAEQTGGGSFDTALASAVSGVCMNDYKKSFCCNPTCFNDQKKCESCCSYGYDTLGNGCFDSTEERKRCCFDQYSDDPYIGFGTIVQMCDESYGFINSSLYGELFFRYGELTEEDKLIVRPECNVSFSIKDLWSTDRVRFNSSIEFAAVNDIDGLPATDTGMTMIQVNQVNVTACPGPQFEYLEYRGYEIYNQILNTTGNTTLYNTFRECKLLCDEQQLCLSFSHLKTINETEAHMNDSVDSRPITNVTLVTRQVEDVEEEEPVAPCRLHLVSNSTDMTAHPNRSVFAKLFPQDAVNCINATDTTNCTNHSITNVTLQPPKWMCLDYVSDFNESEFNNFVVNGSLLYNDSIPIWACEGVNITYQYCEKRYGYYWGDRNATLYEVYEPHPPPNHTATFMTRAPESPLGHDGVAGPACRCANVRDKNWTRNVTLDAFEDPPARPMHLPMEEFFIGLIIFGAVATLRVLYIHFRKVQYNTGLQTVIPKPYFPTSGSVWSLKRYEYNYPAEMEVVQNR